MAKLDISVMESAYLRAKARFEQWKEQFETEFDAPRVDTVVAMTAKKLTKLPPEVQAESRRMNPAEWKNIDKLVTERGKRKEI